MTRGFQPFEVIPRFLELGWTELESGCWEWNGRRDQTGGYGTFKAMRRQRWAHRVSWEHFNQAPVPEGLFVLHSCDNPPCVNPEHLWVGTTADNARDKAQKGRASRMLGELSGNAILTESQVRKLRSRPFLTVGESKILAKQYGVNSHYLYALARGRGWPHIPRKVIKDD